MFSFRLPHKAASRRLCLKAIASIQLIVLVMMAVPALCAELTLDQGREDICISAHAADINNDDSGEECPCCPADGSGEDNCAACSGCAFYYQSAYAPLANYAPSVAQLEAPEHFTKLYEVFLPIFVPPQNLT